MSSSLSIYLDQTSLALKDTSGYTNLSGCIHLENADTLPTWARIQFLGQEKIDTASRIIVDDTYQLSSRPNDWQQDPENKRHFTLLFSFSIPQDMPTSVHICKYHSEDEEETEGGIYYTLEATVSTLKQKSIVPIIIYRPYCSLSVPRRLCWGITGHSNMWQYEIDVPHIMDTCTESGSINLRLRSIQNKSNRVAETCLIGCQLIQVVQLEG
jgi:hypothetical protein